MDIINQYKITYDGTIRFGQHNVIAYGPVTITLQGGVLKVMHGKQVSNDTQLLDNIYTIIPSYWPKSYQIFTNHHYITTITCNPKYMPKHACYNSYDAFNALIPLYDKIGSDLFKRLFYIIEGIRQNKYKSGTYGYLISQLKNGWFSDIEEWIDRSYTLSPIGSGIITLLINTTRNSRLYDLADEIFHCMTGHKLTKRILSCFDTSHVSIAWQDLIDMTAIYDTPILDYYIEELEKIPKEIHQVPTTWMSGPDIFHKIYPTIAAYYIDTIQPNKVYYKGDALQWHIKCKTTQRDFCAKYNIDTINFTYYLIFEQYHSPSSQRVVDLFLGR